MINTIRLKRKMYPWEVVMSFSKVFKYLVHFCLNLSRKFMPEGQVGINSEFGRWITLLSSLKENLVIVEIGTWNGRGTSSRIVDGIKHRGKKSTIPQVIGFEIDHDRFIQAARHLKKSKYFKVIHGRLLDIEELDSSDLIGDEAVWFQQDVAKMRQVPLALDSVPESIDLLILDGGEFSTYAEFKILENRIAGWVLLDDIFMRKCRRIFAELTNSNQYTLVWSCSDRNGTAVFKKIGPTNLKP